MLARRFSSRILVTGATGQVGEELVSTLQHRHGLENVLASDLRDLSSKMHPRTRFEKADVSNKSEVSCPVEDDAYVIIGFGQSNSERNKYHR